MNSVHYLCDETGLTQLKTKEMRLRLLDKEKIKNNKALIQLINIVLPLILLGIFALIFLKLKRKKYA
jgi:ABC-2 type transport system permease protein